MSKTLEEFDVEEQPSSVLEEKFANLTVIHSAVRSLNTNSHVRIFITCNVGIKVLTHELVTECYKVLVV